MEWKTVKLGDVCKIFGRIGFRGYTNNDFVTKPEDGAITLSPTNIVDGELDLTKCAYINWDKYYESPEIMVQENDILLSKTGTIGRTALVKRVEHPMTINPQFVLLKECAINPRYLSYLLKTPKFQGNLYSITVGSVIATLSQKNLGNIKIDIVDSATQDKIVAILSSLDDKIENNNRINRNLETQAQALFKSWFVDFEPWGGTKPEEWKFDDISNIPHVLETGRRPKGGAIESGVPSIGAEHIKGMGTYDFSKTKYISEEYARSLKTGKVNGYELLIYKDGGKPGYFIPNFTIYGEGYPFEECYLNEHVLKLDFSSKAYNIFCYFYFQTQEVMNYLNAQGGKAAIPGINKSDIDNINILTPENEAVVQFGKIVLPYFTKILRNLAENKRLAALRDSLLPKLMKGEIAL